LEIFSNGDKSMNTSGLKIPLIYTVSKINALNWHVVLFLLNTKYWNYEDAIEYAKIVIGDIPEHDPVLIELLLLLSEEVKHGELVRQFIAELANDVDELEQKHSFDKTLFLLLSWLYDNKDSYKNPFDMLTLAYLDFGYPEEIKKLSHPYSLTENEAIIVYQDWEQYLQDEAVRWGK